MDESGHKTDDGEFADRVAEIYKGLQYWVPSIVVQPSSKTAKPVERLVALMWRLAEFWEQEAWRRQAAALTRGRRGYDSSLEVSASNFALCAKNLTEVLAEFSPRPSTRP